VYITGRTLRAADKGGNTGQQYGSLEETANDCVARGGACIPVAVDHNDDEAVAELFEQVEQENNGQLDLLVNNCFAGAVEGVNHGMMATGKGFWDKPLHLWEVNANVGLRSHYVASVFAAKRMTKNKSGIIVNISSPGGLKWFNDVAYGVAKAGVDRLVTDMAYELKVLKTGVSAINLWPGT
jgi:NAD(P)-dependent dehydrogenase (short-subunit alcohol dehydrogenase family)